MILWIGSGLIVSSVFVISTCRYFDCPLRWKDIAFIFLLSVGGYLTVVALFMFCVGLVLNKILNMKIWDKPVFKDKK